MPSGNEIRAMAYSKIAESFFSQTNDNRPSLALTKAALFEWEKEHIRIKDNYIHYWVRWTELVNYYFILKDFESIERMEKTQAKTKGYIQYSRFSQAIKDKDFATITANSLDNYQGVKNAEEESYESKFEELKPIAVQVLLDGGYCEEAKVASIAFFKKQMSKSGLFLLYKTLPKQEFIEVLKPFDNVALLQDHEALELNDFVVRKKPTWLEDEAKNTLKKVELSLFGHRLLSDNSLNEKILENWRFLSVKPPENLYWKDFYTNLPYPWTAYHSFLLNAQEPIKGIKQFGLPIRTAITWDIENGKGISRIDEYAKLSEDSVEIEMALSHCVENYWNIAGYSERQLTELKTNCVFSHAKFSLDRDFTEHELVFLKDSLSKRSPPFKTSKAGLAEIAARQLGEEAERGNLETAEQLLGIMFKALEASPEFEFDTSGTLGLGNYAIAKLKQQNRLKKDVN